MGNLWDKTRSKKRRAFIWSIWHRAVAVNSWRARFIVNIDDKCHMCMNDILETIFHKLWDRRVAWRSWDFAIGIIKTVKAKSGHKGPWKLLDRQHKIFVKKFRSPLASSPKFGYCWGGSRFGRFVWKIMISPLTTTNGTPSKFNKIWARFNNSLSMLYTYGMRLIKKRINTLLTRTDTWEL